MAKHFRLVLMLILLLGLQRDAAAQSDRIVIAEEADAFVLTVPVSHLKMTIPKEGFTPCDGRGRIGSMETAKQQVEDILSTLPEDASLEDIQYHIFVRQKIEQGLAYVDAGRVISHADVERRLAKWLTK